jgi:thiamine biosynthesis lipoprotein
MNRRDFLQPGGLAFQAGRLFGAFQEPPGHVNHAPEHATVSLTRASSRAMATQFEILLPFGTPHSLEICQTAFEEIDQLEQQLTVYAAASEVSRLNQTAPLESVQVEEGLFALLELSQQIWTDTDGAFDITAGALIKEWGFFRGPARVPSSDEIARCLEKVGMQHVELFPRTRAVRFRHPGIELNLGSIGKGYALDRAAGRLRADFGVQAALLHGGRSSVHAIGTQPESADGWPVAIQHPWLPDQNLGVVLLRDQALGTSAATYRYVESGGRKLGHILDPRTGRPAEGVASASVIAPTAAQADALATAFFILGVDAARRYCASHPDVSAVLLPEGESAEVVVIAHRSRCI